MVIKVPGAYTLYMNRKAFTLTEIIIVIIIVAIITAFAFPQMQKAMVKSRVRSALLDIQSIDGAVQNYFNTYRKYPTTGGEFQRSELFNEHFNTPIEGVPGAMNHSYHSTQSDRYTVRAHWEGGPYEFVVDISYMNNYQPCCFRGSSGQWGECFAVPDCPFTTIY